jgi:hypothetical protein
LTANVQPTGRKVSLFNKYLYEIWGVEEIIVISGDLKKIDSLEQILDDIRKNNDLKNDEIQTLETELKRVNQKLKKLSLV